MPDRRVVDAMLGNWRDEVEGALTYRELAANEPDARRQRILIRLAEAEERHAGQWEAHLRALGENPPDRAAVRSKLSGERGRMSRDAWLRRLEADERRDVEKYRGLLSWLPEGEVRTAVEGMAADEAGHARSISSLVPTGHDARSALDRMLRRERWHVSGSAGWIGDAIYGANDGLGAIFGIVAGVAGYSGSSSHLVVVAGLAGMLASALSMGSGAYLAAKAESEVHVAEIERERREIETSPEEEREEMALFYQLKGLSEQESQDLVARLSRHPEAMLKTMVQEELGLTGESAGRPMVSAITSALATAVGAIVPVVPFFFLRGLPAIMVAGAVSLVAHFVVGALKTIVTARGWLSSGLEMTLVGAVEGGITYGLGLFFARL